ncbi:MAG: alanine--tRNA ligase, partial [Clostridia bacterium]|nr:alanine--tRNA ligase [Clostridia bacterium]
LDSGLSILDKMLKETEASGSKILSGENAFKLYDTFGFPIDLTKEITEEKGIEIDEEAFRALMADQKKRAREARANIDAGWAGDALAMIDKTKATEFVGYTDYECDCNIEYIISEGEDNAFLTGGKATVITDKTPFYAESGGQVGDTGFIRTKNGVFAVNDTKKTPEGQYLHTGHIAEGSIEKGPAHAEIDRERRDAIRRNHSALHLLQAALRKHIGTHVEQAGSYVDAERGRFDFTHLAALTTEEIIAVEDEVNAQILNNLPVTTDIMTPDEARAQGAMALFGEKYGDKVRVVSMGDFSKELCGGTHVSATGCIGLFRILGESSVAAGVRRIECSTGFNSLRLCRSESNMLEDIKRAVKATTREEIVHKAEQLHEEIRKDRRTIEDMQRKLIDDAIKGAVGNATDINGVKFIKGNFANVPADVLRASVDDIVARESGAYCLFGIESEGKALFVAGCGAEALKRGAHAGNLLKEISPIVGGGGGGRPNSASSGGKDPSKIADAIEAAVEVIRS